jgi:hypothetical protein
MAEIRFQLRLASGGEPFLDQTCRALVRPISGSTEAEAPRPFLVGVRFMLRPVAETFSTGGGDIARPGFIADPRLRAQSDWEMVRTTVDKQDHRAGGHTFLQGRVALCVDAPSYRRQGWRSP